MRVVLLLIVAAVVGATPGCTSLRAGEASVKTAPLLAVMQTSGRGSVLQLVDLSRGVEVGRIRLRSKAFDVEADPVTQTFVTSQSGGLDRDVDNAIGIIAVRESLRPTYVVLPTYDPLDIATLRGRAYAIHGVCGKQGLAMTVTDIRTTSVVATGWAPDGSGQMDSAAGRVLIPHWDRVDDTDSGTDPERRTALADVGPHLEMTHLIEPALEAGGFVTADPADPSQQRVLLAGDTDGRLGPRVSQVWRIDPSRGRVLGRAVLDDMHAGVYQVSSASGVVAVVDGTGFDPVEGGASIRLLDPTTLKQTRRIALADGPCDVAACDDTAVVAEGGRGRIVVYGADGTRRFELRLAEPDAVLVRLAILEAAPVK